MEMKQKKILLFGGGKAGAEALYYIGKENIAFFGDNQKKLAGQKKYEVEILSYQQVLKVCGDYILVIAANQENALEISNQLETQGITDYVFFYGALKNKFIKEGKNKAMLFFQEIANRLECKAEYFRKVSDEKERQLVYVRPEINAYNLQKMKGFLRKEQIKNTQYAQEILEEIKELCISPFIIAGTLIGARRHNGFIPWDDDIDFGIIRTDYNKLLSYAEKNWHVVRREGPGIINYRQINRLLETYPNEYIFSVSAYCASVYKGTSIADYVVVDFFVFDYFADDYKYSDYRKIILRIMNELEDTRDEIKRLLLEQKAVEENGYIVDESNHLSYSLDNMMAYDHLHESDWINKEDIFPTKQVPFEDIMLPAPQNIDIYLNHDIPGFEGVPSDIGISRRMNQREAVIRQILPTVEIYLTSEDEIEKFTVLYETLRKNSIYAVFVIENKYCNAGDNVASAKIEKRLIDEMYEYKRWIDRTADIAISSVNEDILWKYDTDKKIVVKDEVDHVINDILEIYRKKG